MREQVGRLVLKERQAVGLTKRELARVGSQDLLTPADEIWRSVVGAVLMTAPITALITTHGDLCSAPRLLSFKKKSLSSMVKRVLHGTRPIYASDEEPISFVWGFPNVTRDVIRTLGLK